MNIVTPNSEEQISSMVQITLVTANIPLLGLQLEIESNLRHLIRGSTYQTDVLFFFFTIILAEKVYLVLKVKSMLRP